MSKTISAQSRKHIKVFERNIDILGGPIVKSTVSFAIPIMLSAMLANLYNAADIAVVGNLADKNAVAAVGATSTIIGLLVNIFISIASGYGVILANSIGQRDDLRISRVIKTGYTFSLFLGILVAVLGAIFSKTMLHLTNCPEQIIDAAALYMRIYMISVPASMFYNFNAGILRLKGDTVRPFVYGAISGAVNIILNFTLVILTGEAVVSVAVATVVSCYISAFLLIMRLIKLEGAFKLNPLRLEISGDVLRKIIIYGVPAMISSATFAITNIQVQSAINSFDAAGISGNTAAATIEGFVFAVTNSVSATVSAFIGQCIGADKRERVMQILKRSYLVWSIVGVVVSTLLFTFGKYLLGFLIPGEADAIAFGEIRIFYIAIGTTMHALINVNMGALQGFGKTLYQMIVNIIGVCGFRLFWMLVIYPLSPTPNTLYMCYPISFSLILLVGFIMLFILTRKYKKGEKINI